ncbi:hypothetical protein FS749_010979 [Ceratobasidium sp. UAMH 11750]|nr:hypothetical protein FS749_010979 [Ceratobasidium sp. UAMH 11750]
MFDDITSYLDASLNQPDMSSDAFGMDWSLDASVTVPLDPSSAPPNSTTLAEPNFMFPGLDSATSLNWMSEPSQSFGPLYDTSYYSAPLPLSLPVTENYPAPTPSPALGFISANEIAASSVPSNISAYASPAPSHNSTYSSVYASPAPSHISAYSSPATSYDLPTPSLASSTHSYASPYASPSHAALVYNLPNKPAPFHPGPSLGPNRATRIKPRAPSKPYLRLPPTPAKTHTRSSLCP